MLASVLYVVAAALMVAGTYIQRGLGEALILAGVAVLIYTFVLVLWKDML